MTLQKIAEMICGNRTGSFPYRSSSYLTSFFQDLSLDYRHDGSTRSAWVASVLEQVGEGPASGAGLPSEGLVRVLEHLVHPDHFLNEGGSEAQADCIERVREALRTYSLDLSVDPVTSLASVVVVGSNGLADRLPEPPEHCDPVALVEKLKAGLLRVAAGGQMATDEYLRIRRVLRGDPTLQDHMPVFVRDHRTPDEAVGSLKVGYGGDGTHSDQIRASLNALILLLEEDSVEISEYEQPELVGAGGFGQVYRVRHRLLREDFAIKVLAPPFGGWETGHLERFFREARILLKLNHPNIVRFFDAGMLRRRPFIRTEFFPGITLNRYSQDHGRMPPDKALVLVERIASALAHAHGVGVIHRDLKPSNVMVAPKEQVRVIDFGMSFLVDDVVSRVTKTGERATAGLYCAPELIENPRLVDPRTDIFSIGALWYSALVGRAPPNVHAEGELIRECPALPTRHQAVLLRCLDRIDRRHESCRELLAAIKPLGSA